MLSIMGCVWYAIMAAIDGIAQYKHIFSPNTCHMPSITKCVIITITCGEVWEPSDDEFYK